MTNEQKIRHYAEVLNATAFDLLSLLNDIDIETQQRKDKILLMTPRHKKPKEGSITKRKDGRYEGRYYFDGKQRSVYARTYDECFAKLNKAVAARAELPKKKTLLQWLNEYTELYKKPEVAVETYKQMLRNIRLHIAPQFPVDPELSKVRPSDIQRVLNSVEHDRTRESVYNVFSSALRQALAERYISYDPMLAVKRVKAKRDKGAALSLVEQSEFLSAIRGEKLEAYYLFCLYSGCRRNEVLGVRREDIDEPARTIHIRGTKTELSDRHIPLFDGLRALLDRLPTSGLLFDFTPDYVSKSFKKYCPDHCLHDLRHTFATRALEAGVPLKVVQVWLGHSEIGTTADIYSDVSRELSLSEAVKLDGMFTDSDSTDI